MQRKLIPILENNWWLIGPSPDLRQVIPGAEQHLSEWMKAGKSAEHNAPVDHHIFCDLAGTWHLWGCIRATAVGRIFYHWRTTDIHQSPWESTGEIIRISAAHEESYGSSPGEGASVERREECIQAPFFISENGIYYMFYGAGGAKDQNELDNGTGTWRHWHQRGSQMCLMTSEDGISWTRHKNVAGQSRLFVGPGPTRDACIIQIEGLWHIYYAGTDNDDHPVFWARTSENLIDWSDPFVIHDDLRYGSGRWDCECPHVVFRDGYYYLFRTENYYEAKTHVFRSTDPRDFGIGDARELYVTTIPAAAVEIYTMPDGKEYLSSNHNPPLGTQMCTITWVDE